MIVTVVVIAGLFLWREIGFYRSLNEAVESKWNEETEFINADLSVYSIEPERPPERIKRLQIDDRATIEEIMNDLSSLDLKKDPDHCCSTGKYMLDITVSNYVEEDFKRTKPFGLEISEDFVIVHVEEARKRGYYKILNENPNHLETIKELEEKREWEYFE